MDINIQNLDEKWYEKRMFYNGYGKFPYIILKAGYAMLMQIPIHFNIKDDFDNYPGTHIDEISEAELTEYQRDKTGKLHNRLIKHCQRIKDKIETDYNKHCNICLVEGPETAYYFDKYDITFSTNIPRGGTLLTQDNKILAMNVEHYLL